MEENQNNEDMLTEILKTIAPGTVLREGLENILKAKTGALIIVGDSKEIMDIVDGGFNINEDCTPARLYELAKMDGAIVLSSDMKKILLANAQIMPSHTIPTGETGTRHRTAERTAKQTGSLVISISQRRNIITVFKGDLRYTIEDTSKIITKANQTLQILEKYKKVFDNNLNILNEYEFNDIVTLDNVINCLQRAEKDMNPNLEIEGVILSMFDGRTNLSAQVVEEVKKSIYELGTDGRLVQMQLDELIDGLENEELLIIKDYMTQINKRKTPEKALEEIRDNSVNVVSIAKAMGYENFENYEEIAVYPKGYRILSKVPKVPANIIDNLVKYFKSFQHILLAEIEELDKVDGIGEIRALNIKQTLKRMQEQFVFDNIMI